MSLKKAGPPRKVIPQGLIDLLEDTYDRETFTSVEVDNQKDAQDFIQAARLHAKHTGKSFRHNWSKNGTVLSFQLCDKRPYRQSSLQREN